MAESVAEKTSNKMDDSHSVVVSMTHERKRKRERETDDWERIKAGKMYTSTISNRTKFTDLNIDCLEHVFSYLDFNDLLEIAAWNENTFKAAQLVFSHRFSKHLITLCGRVISQSMPMEQSSFTISEVSSGQKVLHCFSEKIKKLELIDFVNYTTNKGWAYLRSVFNEKCPKNLHELSLKNCDSDLLDNVDRVFENVEKLRIICSHLGKCIDLGNWFPKLEQLELLHDNQCVQIASHFPYLSFLTMDIRNECLSTSNLKVMIESAPQLKTLSLSGGMKIEILQFIGESLPNLKQLFLWDFHLEGNSEHAIVFKNVETLSISMAFLGQLSEEFLFECEKLTDLRVNTEFFQPALSDFVMRQRDLIKFQLITSYEVIDDDEIGKLARNLTKLTELDIAGHFSTDAITRFISNCKSLRKLRIKTLDEVDANRLLEYNNSQWNSVRDKLVWTFERKID